MNTNIDIAISELTSNTESVTAKVERLNKEFSKTLFDEIKEQISKANDKTKLEVINSFIEIGKTNMSPMFKDFINNPEYTAQSLRPNASTGKYEIKPSKRQISFVCLESVYVKSSDGKKESLAQSNLYHSMVARFLHNLSVKFCDDLGTSNGGVKVNTPIFHGEEIKKESDGVDFTKTTIDGLKDQLNEIVTEILPEELQIHMVKADVRALGSSCKRERKMSFKIVSEDELLDKIFNSMEIRMNGKAYVVESNAKCHK